MSYEDATRSTKLIAAATEWRATHDVADAHIAADHMADLILAPEPPAGEFAWLIERHDLAIGTGVMYWAGGVRWSHDANDGIRFSRWQDGANVACTLRCETIVTEHGWCGNTAPAPAVG
jgi:hypothetical protein